MKGEENTRNMRRGEEVRGEEANQKKQSIWKMKIEEIRRGERKLFNEAELWCMLGLCACGVGVEKACDAYKVSKGLSRSCAHHLDSAGAILGSNTWK